MPITLGVVFVFQQQRGATFLGLRLPVPLRRAEGALQYSSTGLGGGVRVALCPAVALGVWWAPGVPLVRLVRVSCGRPGAICVFHFPWDPFSDDATCHFRLRREGGSEVRQTCVLH